MSLCVRECVRDREKRRDELTASVRFNPKWAEGGPQRPTARKNQDAFTEITLMILRLRDF